MFEIHTDMTYNWIWI